MCLILWGHCFSKSPIVSFFCTEHLILDWSGLLPVYSYVSSFSLLILSNTNTAATKHSYIQTYTHACMHISYIQTNRNTHVGLLITVTILCDLIKKTVLLPMKDNVHIMFISCSIAKLFLQANHILNLPTSRKLQTSAVHL